MSSVKKVLLEISQYSQENNCTRDSFLIKLQAQVFKGQKLQVLTKSLLPSQKKKLVKLDAGVLAALLKQ